MTTQQEYESILVGIDGSEQARDAFDTAIEVAKRNDAQIVIAHIVENHDYGMMTIPDGGTVGTTMEIDSLKAILDEYETAAKKRGVTHVKPVLLFGSPKQMMAKELPKEYKTDLILVGQSGLNAIERFMMGSVSAYIIRHAPCDVLVVRAKAEGKK